MSIADVRDGLTRARERAESGDVSTAIAQLDQLLDELTPDRLVSLEDAASLLHVKSSTMLKIWCADGTMACHPENGTFKVPISEIDRMDQSQLIQTLRGLDQVHDSIEDSGLDFEYERDER